MTQIVIVVKVVTRRTEAKEKGKRRVRHGISQTEYDASFVASGGLLKPHRHARAYTTYEVTSDLKVVKLKATEWSPQTETEVDYIQGSCMAMGGERS